MLFVVKHQLSGEHFVFLRLKTKVKEILTSYISFTTGQKA